MKKLVSLCALAALYAGPVLAETPAVKTEAVTSPAAASVEKAKEEIEVEKTAEKKDVATGTAAPAAQTSDSTKPPAEKPAAHAEHEAKQ